MHIRDTKINSIILYLPIWEGFCNKLAVIATNHFYVLVCMAEIKLEIDNKMF